MASQTVDEKFDLINLDADEHRCNMNDDKPMSQKLNEGKSDAELRSDVSVKSSVIVDVDPVQLEDIRCSDVEPDKVLAGSVDALSANVKSGEIDPPWEGGGESDDEMIRRGLPKYDGVYVDGRLCGVEVTMTVDTGATSTLIANRVYQEIPEEMRPRLWQRHSRKKVTDADGRPLKYHGRAVFEMGVGPLEMKMVLIVADIEDDVLLGGDILQRDPSGPADILLSKNEMILKGVTIPLTQIGVPKRSRKAYAADDYIIPAMSEAVIDVHVDRLTAVDDEAESRVLIEGDPLFTERSALVVAPCLCDVSCNTTGKVRLMNPFKHDVPIMQDTVVGVLQTVQADVTKLMNEEDPGEKENFDGVRRIALRSSDVVDRQPVRQVGARAGPADVMDADVPLHLRPMFEDATEGRSEEEKVAVAELIKEYQDVFSKTNEDLGLTNICEHAIDTGDAKPIKQPPRRTPRAFAGEEDAAIEKLLKQGSIRPSTSPWSSPVVLVRKKDGSVRPCIDYRLVNAVTHKDAYPLPRTQDCLDAVAGASIFSTLDITSAYNQVPVKKEDVQKTAFVTKKGLFEFTTMPFGLCNAPATFQRLMEICLRGLAWVICLIYLDDCIVYARDFLDHLARLKLVFQRIRLAGLKLKPSKCHLLKSKVTFLGHVVSEEGVLPNPQNTEKVMKWPVPKTVTEVRSFLGLVNYYRRFVRGHSEIVRPLVNLVKKNESFQWTEACTEAFEKLKKILVSPDVMAHPLDDGMYILDTDACDVSIGAVLSQVQHGKERVIAYGSKTLSKAECNYCTTDRELLAVKEFVEYYKQYLLGRHFVVRSDHQALKWLFSLKEPKNRISRWIEILSAYDFEVEYRPGVRHGNADGMSRCPNPRECKCVDDKDTALRCGPCKRCVKRTEDMEGSFEGEVRTRRCGTRTHDDVGDVSMLSSTQQGVWQCMMMIWTWLVWVGGLLNPFEGLGEGTYRTPEERKAGKTVLDNRVKTKDAPQKIDGFPMIIRRTAVDVTHTVRKVCGTVLRLSRGYKPSKEGAVSTWIPWCEALSWNKLRKQQLDDPDVAPVLKWVEKGDRPFGPDVCASSLATRHYWNSWSALKISHGVLFRQFTKKDGTGSYLQLVVPMSMRDEILHQMHNAVLSGHLGEKKTREKLLQQFYWYGVREDIRNWVRKCDTCGSIKTPSKTARAPLGKMPVGAPMDRLGIDVLGPLPETPRGNRHIIVVTDHFSKWTEVFPVPDFMAATCARVLLNDVISRFGCPYDVLSDQGRNFESQLFAELCDLLEIRKVRTSPGHPEGNGLTERFNKTLVAMIKAYLKGEDSNWDLHLGCLTAAYRATKHESTGVTPNLLMLGREVRLPAEIVYGSRTSDGSDVNSYGSYIDDLKCHLQKAHDVARRHMKSAAERCKELYDSRVSFTKYNPGDQVWMMTGKGQTHIAPKLRVAYEGPFLVMDRITDLSYLVQFDARGRRKVVHHNKLKLYEGDQKLRCAKRALQTFLQSK